MFCIPADAKQECFDLNIQILLLDRGESLLLSSSGSFSVWHDAAVWSCVLAMYSIMGTACGLCTEALRQHTVAWRESFVQNPCH